MKVVRVSLVVWLVVAVAVAFGLYQVKYEVQRLEEELRQVRGDIRRDRVALHVLEAEWAYLNRPERLERLAEKHLDMGPAGAQQVAAVTALPPRIADGDSALASAGAAGPDGMPLPRARPWSLEQPRYARADAGEARVRTAAAEAGDVPEAARHASRTVAEVGAGADSRDGPDGPPASRAGLPPRPDSRPANRTVTIGNVMIRVGAQP